MNTALPRSVKLETHNASSESAVYLGIGLRKIERIYNSWTAGIQLKKDPNTKKVQTECLHFFRL